MRIDSIYHFHKDCIYFTKDDVQEVKEGGHKIIIHNCPIIGTRRYYKGDFYKIRWECAKFVPIQEELKV